MNNIHYTRFSILILSLTLASFGCASAKRSQYLTNFDEMKDGKHLEKIMVSPDLKLGNYATLELRKPTIETNTSPQFSNTSVEYLTTAFYEELRRIEGLNILLEGKENPHPAEKTLVLETGITKLEPGSRLMRFLAGEVGGGHSHVQVDGRLIDAATGKIVFQFTDRRAGSGFGSLDITGGDPQDLIESDLGGIANALGKTLAELR